MKMTPEEIYWRRKEFFNNHAVNWQDMWYKNHATGRYDKHARDFERLFSIIQLNAGDHVLDVGCGTGVLVPFILELITEKGMLYELDYADRMIEVNKELNKADNIRFIIADAEAAPLDDASCDVIVCFACFPHLHDREKAMMTFSRILKSRGRIAVCHFISSEGIKKHHEAHHAVMHDCLPDKDTMYSLFHMAGLDILLFTDEPDFYCVLAQKN